jgi:hypothetical protein
LGAGAGTIIIGLTFIIISAIAKSIMDKLQFHYDRSIFKNFKNQQFWDGRISWRNKWKNGQKEQGEKFPGSSTFFVFTTDAWHLFQSIFLNSLFIGLFFIGGNYDYLNGLVFLLARIVFGLIFTYTFHKKLENI